VERIPGPFPLRENSDLRALFAFRYQIRKFLHFSESAARHEGLEPQQHQLLLAMKALEEEGQPSIRTLADHLFIQHHSAVGLIDRLVDRGLVKRVPNQADRRQVIVRLTSEGDRILHRLSSIHWEELRQSAPALVTALQSALR
jgi:DNA-binding MarR family transcriptional regulator